MIGPLADVVRACACTIELNHAFETPFDHLTEGYAVSGGGAANVAQTDEADPDHGPQ